MSWVDIWIEHYRVVQDINAADHLCDAVAEQSMFLLEKE